MRMKACLGLAMAALLTLGACATRYQPMAAAVGPPRWADDAVIAADGYRLPLRDWQPEEAPQAVLLAVHGFNDYSLAFDEAAGIWAGQGILTYAYDQRGFGATEGFGIWPDTATLAEDLRIVAELVRTRHPDLPLVVLGESMGGAVALTAGAAAVPPPVDRYVLVAPGVLDMDTLSDFALAAVWLAENGMGGLWSRSVGTVRRPTDNIEVRRALWLDPLVIKDTRADAVAGLVRLLDAGYDAVARFDAPALVLYGAHEEVVPTAGMRRVIEDLPVDRTRVAVYRHGYHLLLRDFFRRSPIRDIAAWVIDPEAALPSGAEITDRTGALAELGLGPDVSEVLR